MFGLKLTHSVLLVASLCLAAGGALADSHEEPAQYSGGQQDGSDDGKKPEDGGGKKPGGGNGGKPDGDDGKKPGYAYKGQVTVAAPPATTSCSATCTANGNRLTASASGAGATCGRGANQAQVFAQAGGQTTACNCARGNPVIAGVRVPANSCVTQ